jgi:hypothetical protein
MVIVLALALMRQPEFSTRYGDEVASILTVTEFGSEF